MSKLIQVTETDPLAQAAHADEIPEPLARMDHRVLRCAERLSLGDWRRCTAEPDGSVIVWNGAVA